MQHPQQPFEPGQEYVLGFAFTQHRDQVLLIRKTKPKWQAGKLNGVGGKIEQNDWSVVAAMQREFKEETGISTELDQWSCFAQHLKPGTFNYDPSSYTLHVLSAVLTDEQFQQLTQTTDEEPVLHYLNVRDLMNPLTIVDGTLMYITMALNHMGRPFSTVTIEEAQ